MEKKNLVAVNTSLVGKTFKRPDKEVYVKVVEYNEKTNTVILEFENGKSISLNTSTLKDKRKWIPVDDAPTNVVEETPVVETTKVVVEETPIEPVVEPSVEKTSKKTKVNKENTSSKSKKTETKSEDVKGKREVSNDVQDMIKYIMDKIVELGGTVGVPSDENFRFRALQFGGRQVIKLMWTKKEAKLFCKSSIIGDSVPTKVINYSLPSQFNFEVFNDDTKKTIDSLIKASVANRANQIEARKNKNSQKKED